MKPEKALYYADRMEHMQKKDRIFMRNPVFIVGLGLAPVVIAASTMENACILGLAVALLLTPTRVIGALLSSKVYYRLRCIVYSLTVATLYIGVYWLLTRLFGPRLMLVGIYLPLLVMDPLLISRFENPVKERPMRALQKGLQMTAGFLIALFLVAALRELLGQGALFGVPITPFAAAPLLASAGGGFILVGLLAALWRAALSNFKARVAKGASQANG